jgi:hypothetical protein
MLPVVFRLPMLRNARFRVTVSPGSTAPLIGLRLSAVNRVLFASTATKGESVRISKGSVEKLSFVSVSEATPRVSGSNPALLVMKPAAAGAVLVR